MKQLNNYDVLVPEMGDKAEITEVSNAIEDVEDALAGTVEFMSAVITDNLISLTSDTRTVDRIRYYSGLCVQFISPKDLDVDEITQIKIDDLSEQSVTLNFKVKSGEMLSMICGDDGSFTSNYFTAPFANSDVSYQFRGELPNMTLDTAYDILDMFALKDGYYNVRDDATNYGMFRLNIDHNEIYGNGQLLVMSEKGGVKTYKYIPYGSGLDNLDNIFKRTCSINIWEKENGSMSTRKWIYNISKEEIDTSMKKTMMYRGDLPNQDVDKMFTIDEMFDLTDGYYYVSSANGTYGASNLNLDTSIIYPTGTLYVAGHQDGSPTYQYIPIGDGNTTDTRTTTAHVAFHKTSSGDMSTRKWIYNISEENINNIIDTKDKEATEDLYQFRGTLPDNTVNSAYTMQEMFNLKAGTYDCAQYGTSGYSFNKLNIDPTLVYSYGTLEVRPFGDCKLYAYTPHTANQLDYKYRRTCHIAIYWSETGDMSTRKWIYNLDMNEIWDMLNKKANLSGAHFTGSIQSNGDISAFYGQPNVQSKELIIGQIIEYSIMVDKAKQLKFPYKEYQAKIKILKEKLKLLSKDKGELNV